MTSLREANAVKAARRRFEAREFLNGLKKEPCKDCRNKFHPCQMDFVRNGAGQPVSRMLLKSKATILRAAMESDLVCANCGRLRVWNKQRQLRSGPT